MRHLYSITHLPPASPSALSEAPIDELEREQMRRLDRAEAFGWDDEARRIIQRLVALDELRLARYHEGHGPTCDSDYVG